VSTLDAHGKTSVELSMQVMSISSGSPAPLAAIVRIGAGGARTRLTGKPPILALPARRGGDRSSRLSPRRSAARHSPPGLSAAG
jgi:hypothetical protein